LIKLVLFVSYFLFISEVSAPNNSSSAAKAINGSFYIVSAGGASIHKDSTYSRFFPGRLCGAT